MLGMSSPSTDERPRRLTPGTITAWCLWSWGNASVSAVMTTFVFGTYIASEAFGADGRGTQHLTAANAIAGALIALTAPVIGQRADSSGRRHLWLVINTVIVAGLVAACFFVKPEEGYLLLGVTLIAGMGMVNEFAELNYNAMLVDIADDRRIGRISGIGWGSGYLGGIVILMIVYLGLIAGDPPHWFGLGEDEAINIRTVALAAAAWFLVWAIPLLVSKRRTADRDRIEKVSIRESYRRLFGTLADLWRGDRNTLWFLISSAIYRDGLSAVFTYGAILGVSVYGIAADDVIIFGIAANVVAAVGAFIGGWLDDALGPRAVVAGCLTMLTAIALVMFFLDEPTALGPAEDPWFVLQPTLAFWIFGLGLSFFVGPAQAASRAFLGRLAPGDRAGELFGLYATAGRSASFLTPAMISIFVGIFHDEKFIIVGVFLVLLGGLASLLLVRNPTGPAKLRDHAAPSAAPTSG
ncbi:MFS transporter [Nesterenkonia halobia]|uniref:MFS transporter n=2 Tax=Nesterenkonia halobia TaxID=37922 RepID=A0ABP6RJ60_9MICC